MTRDLDRKPALGERAFVGRAGHLALIAFLAVFGTAAAQNRPVPDTYTATTTGMTPDGQGLRFVVTEWSDDDDRFLVVATILSAPEASDEVVESGEPAEAAEADEADETDESDEAEVADVPDEPTASELLSELPSVGAVWLDGSGAGYAIKYAHRTATGEGGELVTLVTDRAVGSYSFRPWEPETSTATTSIDYSVIELRLDSSGNGVGTMSLAADVSLDEEADTVSLVIEDGTPNILTDVALQPKPYWATDDE